MRAYLPYHYKHIYMMGNEQEHFDICVEYESREECFECVFSTYGYSYRITVKIDETEVIYEPDEERRFRARVENAGSPGKRLVALVLLVGTELEKQFKGG